MNHFEKVFQCFPEKVREEIGKLPAKTRESIEEIRVYRGREVQIFADGKRISLTGRTSGRDINNLLNNLMKFSYYAYEEDIAKGFITIDGGHRVGICGKAVVDSGHVSLIRDVSSLNIRCSKEILGCSDRLIKYAVGPDGELRNLLVISPPACGKTTLLRDLARNLSFLGCKVGICDERSEIAGMSAGISHYTFGTMVDVLDGCPKAEGMCMMIRSMSPQIIITDEISTEEDGAAVRACAGSGVSVIASAHGSSLEDMKKTGVWSLIENHTFDYLIFLTNRPRAGTIGEVRCG